MKLNLKLKVYDDLRESDILVNEIDTPECILGHMSDLKYGDKVKPTDIIHENKDLRGEILKRKNQANYQLTWSSV